MSVRRNCDLGATKAEPRLCRDPKLRNGPTLKDTEEEIEDPKYANKAHDYLEATDVPAEDGNTQEKGCNGELYERRCQDVCQLTKIPVLKAISTFLSIFPFSFFNVIIPSLQSWHSQVLNIGYVGQSHSGFRTIRMQNNKYIWPAYALRTSSSILMISVKGAVVVYIPALSPSTSHHT